MFRPSLSEEADGTHRQTVSSTHGVQWTEGGAVKEHKPFHDQKTAGGDKEAGRRSGKNTKADDK